MIFGSSTFGRSRMLVITRYSGHRSMPLGSRATTYVRVCKRYRANVVFPLPVCPMNAARSVRAGTNDAKLFAALAGIALSGAFQFLKESTDMRQHFLQLRVGRATQITPKYGHQSARWRSRQEVARHLQHRLA